MLITHIAAQDQRNTRFYASSIFSDDPLPAREKTTTKDTDGSRNRLRNDARNITALCTSSNEHWTREDHKVDLYVAGGEKLLMSITFPSCMLVKKCRAVQAGLMEKRTFYANLC